MYEFFFKSRYNVHLTVKLIHYHYHSRLRLSVKYSTVVQYKQIVKSLMQCMLTIQKKIKERSSQ